MVIMHSVDKRTFLGRLHNGESFTFSPVRCCSQLLLYRTIIKWSNTHCKIIHLVGRSAGSIAARSKQASWCDTLPEESKRICQIGISNRVSNRSSVWFQFRRKLWILVSAWSFNWEDIEVDGICASCVLGTMVHTLWNSKPEKDTCCNWTRWVN